METDCKTKKVNVFVQRVSGSRNTNFIVWKNTFKKYFASSVLGLCFIMTLTF